MAFDFGVPYARERPNMHARALSEITHVRVKLLTPGVEYIAETFGTTKSLSEGINCLFASNNRVRTVLKRSCVIFMAFSCPSVVLGRLI